MEDQVAEIKPLIRSILLALGRRATEREFRNEFYNTEGENFNSILRKFDMPFWQFLKNMPDVCRVYKIGFETFVERVANEESSHMDNLTILKKRKRPSRNNFRPAFNSFNRRLAMQPFTMPTPHNQRVFRPMPVASFGNSSQRASAPRTQIINIFQKLPPKPVSTTAYPTPPHMLLPKIVYKPKAEMLESPHQTANDQSKNSIKTIPTPTSSLPPHMRLPMKVFKSSDDKAGSTSQQPLPIVPHMRLPRTVYKPDTANRSHDPKGSVKLNSSSSSDWSDNGSTKTSPRRIPISRGMNLNQIMLHLNQETLGLRSIIKIPDNPHSSRKPVRRPQKVIVQQEENPSSPKGDPKSLTIEQQSLKEEQSISENVDAQEFVKEAFDIPEPYLKVLKCCLNFDVTLTTVNTPSHFVFQFNEEELQPMLVEMNEFYCINDDKLSIPEPLGGMAVAVIKGGQWHRAQIIITNTSDALVFFVDLYVEQMVKLKDLRYLKRSLASKTRKACKGSLFGVLPKNAASGWSREATLNFMETTNEVTLKAVVRRISECGAYELALIKGNFKVADSLVQNGFAKTDDNKSKIINAIIF